MLNWSGASTGVSMRVQPVPAMVGGLISVFILLAKKKF
jgi:hypothetical protein